MCLGVAGKWVKLIAISSCALLVGCGGSGKVAKVSGTVTLDGQPLPEALVLFSPKIQGSPSSAKTDANGNYSLTYSREEVGAEIGDHSVAISTYARGDADSDPPKPAVPEKVPIKYNTKTELTATVKSGTNTIDFPLESSGKIVQPGKPR